MSQKYETQLMMLAVEIRRDRAVPPADAWRETTEFIRDAMHHGAETRRLETDASFEIEYAGGKDSKITIDIVDAWPMPTGDNAEEASE